MLVNRDIFVGDVAITNTIRRDNKIDDSLHITMLTDCDNIISTYFKSIGETSAYPSSRIAEIFFRHMFHLLVLTHNLINRRMMSDTLTHSKLLLEKTFRGTLPVSPMIDSHLRRDHRPMRMYQVGIR